MRYTYLGTVMTDPRLIGKPCDSIRRTDGRCIVGRGNALVLFEGETNPRIVSRRRLRVNR